MFKNRLIQWILSKLFPYGGGVPIEVLTKDSDWDKQKLRENEEFYGGRDGTWRY